jgi:hypothetical protein
MYFSLFPIFSPPFVFSFLFSFFLFPTSFFFSTAHISSFFYVSHFLFLSTQGISSQLILSTSLSPPNASHPQWVTASARGTDGWRKAEAAAGSMRWQATAPAWGWQLQRGSGRPRQQNRTGYLGDFLLSERERLAPASAWLLGGELR